MRSQKSPIHGPSREQEAHLGPADRELFMELIRDALLHLYDVAHLQTHPLINVVRANQPGAMAAGRALRLALLDAIEALRPAAGVGATSQAWRAYRILELRYVEGQDVAQVMAHLAISKSQYHREHQRALTAVASILWERWQLEARWSAEMLRSSPGRDTHGLVSQEVRLLSHDAGTDLVDPVQVLHEVCQILNPLCQRRHVILQLKPQGQSLGATSLPLVRNRVALRHALLTVLVHAIETSYDSAIDVVIQYHEALIDILLSGQTAQPVDPASLGLLECRPFIEVLGGHVILERRTYVNMKEQWQWLIRISLPSTGCRRLLVVDNNPDFVRLIERYLSSYSWDVRGASRIEEALSIAQQSLPAAILLDILIPGRDGLDLLIELKSNTLTRDIPVIVCSVLREPEIALSLGAAAYLQKPVTQQELLDALNRCQERIEKH